MRKSILAAAIVGVAFAARADAKEYGEKGTFEAGGTVSFDSSSQDFEGSTTKTTELGIEPTIGYFVIEGLQLQGLLIIGSELNDYEDGSADSLGTFGLAGGIGYFFKAGNLRVGPEMLVGIVGVSSEIDDGAGDKTTVDGSATVFGLGGVIKVPIGTGGVLSVGAGFRQTNATYEVEDTSFDSTTTGFGTNVGFSVFF